MINANATTAFSLQAPLSMIRPILLVPPLCMDADMTGLPSHVLAATATARTQRKGSGWFMTGEAILLWCLSCIDFAPLLLCCAFAPAPLILLSPLSVRSPLWLCIVPASRAVRWHDSRRFLQLLSLDDCYRYPSVEGSLDCLLRSLGTSSLGG